MNIDQASPQQLRELFESLQAKYTSLQAEKLSLDLTRGKPAIAQLELASDLDGILQGNYHTRDGAETRNYANVWGIPEARELGGEVLDIPASNVLAGGNSSLTLMFFTALTMMQYGVRGEGFRVEYTRCAKVYLPSSRL